MQGFSVLKRVVHILTTMLYRVKTIRYSINFSETSVDFQLTTWRYVPEDRTSLNHRC
jgi:hypothetical protein